MIKKIDIHLANVSGLGAKIFCTKIIEEISASQNIVVDHVYYHRRDWQQFYYEAHFFHSVPYFFPLISRLLEIFLWRFKRSSANEILVLGDVPLNTLKKQYVLLHQSLIFKKFPFWKANKYKFFIFRLCYKYFMKPGDVVLVQSEHMKKKVKDFWGNSFEVRTLSLSGFSKSLPVAKRTGRVINGAEKDTFRLLYPAAVYPHKNHYLLDELPPVGKLQYLVTATRTQSKLGNGQIIFLDKLSRDKLMDLYSLVDGLLFLSSEESLGLPLVEAVQSNLPIICPRLEYSNWLAGDNVFFFDDRDASSLGEAINLLVEKLESGWWPSWNDTYSADAGLGTPIIELIS